ncbi:MAG: YbaN family protein [Candidatus Methanoplasma sp.]|nr:YbaN family protein [Candidatus Methanoplasma sp.]
MTVRKALLLVAGFLALGAGAAGALLPLIPTTPFVLLAAACFGASSPRMRARLESARYFGEYLRNYREGTGISRRARWTGVAFLWATLSLSAILFRHAHAWIALAIVGACVTAHILTIRGSRGAADHAEGEAGVERSGSPADKA